MVSLTSHRWAVPTSKRTLVLWAKTFNQSFLKCVGHSKLKDPRPKTQDQRPKSKDPSPKTQDLLGQPQPFQFLDTSWPVGSEESRKGAVGKQFSASLTVGTIVGFV